ncbi:protein translocase subunit SecD, partial [Corallococcus sp. AB032C]
LQATPPPAGSEITLTTEGGFPQLQAPTREAITEYTKDKVPENRVVLTECIANPVKKNECTSYRSYLLDKNVPLTGESLASADANISQLNEPEVNISFDPAGAREFERLTEQGVGRRMAIVLDENVQTAPNINEK